MTVDAMGPKSSLLRRIKEATMRDGQAKQLVRLARDGVTRKFVVDGGLIKTRRGSIFVPKWGKSREEVMRWCHDFMICGRPSVRKMMAMLGREFYWHHMVMDVKWFVKTCLGSHRGDGDSPKEVKSKGRSPFAPRGSRPWRSKVRLRGDATRASRE
uniref:Integrase zinc-binding domain-containing protein n=2 Tax=Manihot esculenta TaxID=3983 RepID=A0A2C9U4D8_MANES